MENNKSAPGFSTDEQVIIVEDSRIFAHILRNAVINELGTETVVCSCYKEAQDYLEHNSQNVFAALLDLNLPDAPYGEIVDLVVGKGIASIVFTGEVSDDLRDRMWSKHIVDYILKDNQQNVQQVLDVLKRLRLNSGIKILVADDSSTSRKIIRDLLQVWNFKVLEARNGREALDVLNRHEGIRLLLADYNMPVMDGMEMVKEARRNFSKTRLPIIGLSGAGGATTSAHFLKAGANDYMHKPFLAEELYCRVRHNLETSEYIMTIRDMAEKDFLTGLLNRRSFFSSAGKLFENARRGNLQLVVAMMDIDHFKRCNDQYGHDAGDEVIRYVADTLQSTVRKSDLVARFGGEEFCVVGVNMRLDHIETAFDNIREAIEQSVITAGEYQIRVTVSTGVCSALKDSLEEMITCADDLLYKAKNQGRNRVVTDISS
ncbi:diguanylate cyclase [Desulfonatronospira sp.]|uniref:diguanylate cyclase n=1 Tax=Desulfonatronospira sp. TaxID=1962951 RepID=UPI0025BD95BA|nr:diguanylate cyclase [Desulfonatronospira sp.]